MRKKLLLSGAMAWLSLAPALAGTASVLPPPDAPFKGKIDADRSKSQPDWPEQVKAPARAPNVVLILLDDVGFGAPGTFGGPAATPELDKLAKGGVRFNQFHTTAICSPTRASLLTGRNQHQTGFGNLQDVPAGFPGYNTIWHKETASVAEILKQNGYSTAAFGKWHNTPTWEISPVGPFEHWPTGLGFEYFYGFLYGEASQYEPRLYRGTTPVEPPSKPEQGYHLTTDLVNDALRWVHQHDAVAADKPFFLYFATGATHAPHHVPKEWIDKYKGKFDQGWDKLREETFARQKALGVIPANAELTPRPDGLPAWNSLTADQKKLYAHQMEVYSAFLEHTDHEVGRLLQGLKDEGKADNTLVLYVVGDNGGSAEGGLEGSENNFATLGGAKQDVPTMLSHLSDLGSPEYDNHYAAGWSWATTTPFQWMKQVASHFGGTRDGFVVSWPGHTNKADVIRNQFSHVNDVVPTIFAAAGIDLPKEVNGTKQIPLEGKNLLPALTNPAYKTGHNTQYFEIFGNRAIYKDGWVAGVRRYAPWELFTNPIKIFGPDFGKEKWELYHVDEDFSQAHDLAEKFPDKLKELQAEFDKEARRNGVYPLVPLPQGAPSPVTGKTHFTYSDGVTRLPLAQVPDVGIRSHRFTADIEVPASGASGVIFAEGGRYGGFSLYIKDGKLVYENNTFGTTAETIVADQPLPAGKVTITFEYERDLVSSLKQSVLPLPKPTSGTGKLLINGKEAGKRKFSVFGAFTSSVNESFDIGEDSGSPVSRSYASPNRFNGTIHRVTLDLL